MTSLQHILQQLFRKETLEEISVEQLEQLTQEYPLFAPAHYLLARKYKATGNEQFQKQIQKTALHFHNPLWLHYQLAEQPSSNDNTSRVDYNSNITAETTIDEAALTTPDLIETVVAHQEITPEITAPLSTAALPEPDFGNDRVEIKENATDDAHIAQLYHTNSESEALKIAESSAAEAVRIENDGPQQPVARLDTSEAEVFKLPTETSVENADSNTTGQAGIHPLFGKSSEEDEAKMSFEPYYTVDYFASQGIKANQEIKTDDRLGKQMKSFTEWLKTMRKLPEATVEAELQKINDREIEHIAAHSLEGKEVLTEAMAEVLAKQGRHEQAADVYRKLSLLNPGKSAYFAARIDALKNQ